MTVGISQVGLCSAPELAWLPELSTGTDKHSLYVNNSGNLAKPVLFFFQMFFRMLKVPSEVMFWGGFRHTRSFFFFNHLNVFFYETI